jgi:NADPH:quinone reductase-like Zn-dependent oxidoreductase
MMKAMVYTKYGLPDVLHLEEVEKPAPGDDEALIKVHAASVNSWDWDLLRGKPLVSRIGALRNPRYKILGADIAGRVEAVGANVKRFQIGDEVFGDPSGCGWGGFAEYVCGREDALALKPAGLTFEEAAAVPQAAVLALQGLRGKGRIKSGQKVLINGAGGGVGTFAVQIARSFGAEVTGVDSAAKLDLVRSLGAGQAIDYAQVDFTKNGQTYDLILDMVVDRSSFDYKRALSPDGTFVVIGGTTPRILQTVLLGLWLSKTSSKKMGILLHKPDPADLVFMNELFESRKVAPVIDRRYPLSDVAEALRYFASGQVQGKIVITM